MLKILGLGVGRSLLQPFVPYVTRSKDVWVVLDWIYGADTVNRMLERHPIKARIDDRELSDLLSSDGRKRQSARDKVEAQILSANDYCQLWLQRYAADVAVPPRARRSLILGTAALPAILLPQSLRRVGDDLDWIVSLIGPLRVVLVFGAVVLFIGALREGAARAAVTFHHFVIVELAEQTHRRASGTT
jgi:hypothetical protein